VDCKINAANSTRYKDHSRFLYDIPDSQSGLYSELQILKRQFNQVLNSQILIFSDYFFETFETALLANPSITKADNASSRFVLSPKVNISPVAIACQFYLSDQLLPFGRF